MGRGKEASTMTAKAVRWLLNLSTRIYLEKIEVKGRGHLPRGASILAGNHPSGLMDPMVLFSAFPSRQLTSIAKASLFQQPIVSFFVKTMRAVPVAKAYDPDTGKMTPAAERRAMNERMFGTVKERLRDGIDIVIFPEGTCHSTLEIKDLKVGTALMALSAAAEPCALLASSNRHQAIGLSAAISDMMSARQIHA